MKYNTLNNGKEYQGKNKSNINYLGNEGYRKRNPRFLVCGEL